MPAQRYGGRGSGGRVMRTPRGRMVFHYTRKKAKAARCARCGRRLGGVPGASKLRFLPKSSKRPSRPYGGNLCPICARQMLKESVRVK